MEILSQIHGNFILKIHGNVIFSEYVSTCFSWVNTEYNYYFRFYALNILLLLTGLPP